MKNVFKITEITLLSNEIFVPKYFCADCQSAIRFAISPILSEKQAHLVWKALAVGWFAGAARQTSRNKRPIHPPGL
jgi:hypothetical protein